MCVEVVIASCRQARQDGVLRFNISSHGRTPTNYSEVLGVTTPTVTLDPETINFMTREHHMCLVNLQQRPETNLLHRLFYARHGFR